MRNKGTYHVFVTKQRDFDRTGIVKVLCPLGERDAFVVAEEDRESFDYVTAVEGYLAAQASDTGDDVTFQVTESCYRKDDGYALLKFEWSREKG